MNIGARPLILFCLLAGCGEARDSRTPRQDAVAEPGAAISILQPAPDSIIAFTEPGPIDVEVSVAVERLPGQGEHRVILKVEGNEVPLPLTAQTGKLPAATITVDRAGSLTIVATLWPEDGSELIASASVTVEVRGPPSAPSVALTPDPLTSGDTLLAALATGSSSSSCSNCTARWTVHRKRYGGLLLPLGAYDVEAVSVSIPAKEIRRGDEFTVRAQVHDPETDLLGSPGEASIVVQNRPPLCDGQAQLGDSPTSHGLASCSTAVVYGDSSSLLSRSDRHEDQEEGNVCCTASFYVNGVLHTDGTSGYCSTVDSLSGTCTVWISMAGSGARPGDGLSCTLTLHDEYEGPGQVLSQPCDSATVEVVASPPEGGSDAIEPLSGQVDTLFRCNVSIPAKDPDGFPVFHRFTIWEKAAGVEPWIVHSIPDPADSPVSLTYVEVTPAAMGIVSGHEIGCHVTFVDEDGLTVEGPLRWASVQNALPSIGKAWITPSGNVQASSVLTCNHTDGYDADGDSFEVLRTFDVVSMDGTTTTHYGQKLANPAAGTPFFKSGDIITCRVQAIELGSNIPGSAAVSSPVTVVNTPPSLPCNAQDCPQLTVVPTPDGVKGTFKCLVDLAKVIDADLDDAGSHASIETLWKVNNTMIGEGSTLSGALAALKANMKLICCTKVKDKTSMSPEYCSPPHTIPNSLPSLLGVTLSCSPKGAQGDPVVNSTCTCQPGTYEDADGDSPVFAFDWWVQDKWIGVDAGQFHLLDSGTLPIGTPVRCKATPQNLSGLSVVSGSPVESAVVHVVDSPPIAGAATLSPAQPGKLDMVTCALEGYYDPDPVHSVTDFEVDLTVGGLTLTQSSKSSQVSFALPPGVKGGDTVKCRGRVSSGDWSIASEYTPWSAPSVVVNQPPLCVGKPVVKPASPVGGDTLKCTWACDTLDGDPLQWTYSWKDAATGAPMGSGQTVIALSGTKPVCHAYVTDGEADDDDESGPVEVGNNPPSLSTVDLQSGSGVQSGATCSAYAADPELDPVHFHFEWLKTSAGTPPACEAGDSGILADSIGTGPNPSAQTYASFAQVGVKPGETLTCRVRVSQAGFMSPPKCASKVVTNGAPTITGQPQLSAGGPAFVTSTLTCTPPPAESDPDGDALECTVLFLVDGAPKVSVPVSSCTASAKVAVALLGAVEVGSKLTCRFDATDGAATTAATSNPLAVADSPPTILPPTLAAAESGWSCTVGASFDADGDPVTVLRRWTIQGVVVPNVATPSVKPSQLLSAGAGGIMTLLFKNGDLLRCEEKAVTTTASTVWMPSNPVVLSHLPPVVGDVVISPTVATKLGPLSCALGAPAVDPEGATVTVAYQWWIDGELVAVGSSLSTDHFAVGDYVTCVAVVSDGDLKTTTLPVFRIVANSPPGATSAAVIPSVNGGPGDTFWCSSDLWDPDGPGDLGVPWVTWTVDGKVVLGVVGEIVSGTALGLFLGAEVACHVVPVDVWGTSGSPTSSPPFEVVYAPPEVFQVEILPAKPLTTDSLKCTAQTSDSLVPIVLKWTTALGIYDGAVLPPTYTAKGQSVTCTAVLDDGVHPASTKSSTVTILNSPPSFGLVTVSPSAVKVGGAATCSPVQFIDSDGDFALPLKSAEWIDNAQKVLGVGLVIVASQLPIGVPVLCRVRAWDGTDEGSWQTSYNHVLRLDASPGAPPVAWALPAVAGEPTVCSWGSSFDPDGDTILSYEVEVTMDGTTLPAVTKDGPGSLIVDTGALACQEVACSVTAHTSGAVSPAGNAAATVEHRMSVEIQDMDRIEGSARLGRIGSADLAFDVRVKPLGARRLLWLKGFSSDLSLDVTPAGELVLSEAGSPLGDPSLPVVTFAAWHHVALESDGASCWVALDGEVVLSHSDCMLPDSPIQITLGGPGSGPSWAAPPTRLEWARTSVGPRYPDGGPPAPLVADADATDLWPLVEGWGGQCISVVFPNDWITLFSQDPELSWIPTGTFDKCYWIAPP